MFVRTSTHRAIVREKDMLIGQLAGMVESQSERLLVVAGYRPLLPQRGPVPVQRGRQLTDDEREFEVRLADATEL